MALAQKLEQAWYGERRTPLWTHPLAWLYGGVTGLRRTFYRRGWRRTVRLPVPVVVIGNITAGGTGKTPLTIAVARELRERGFTPGVVSRGYGGRQREPLLLNESPNPQQVGDEPSLIRTQGIPVAVGRNRPAAARLLIGAGCDVIIADDGLQHYRLARDVEICVIDAVRGFGNGRLLPAGPLREPLMRLVTSDMRVCNGGERMGAYPMQLQGGEACSLSDDTCQPLTAFTGQRVHAVAAIGHPARFFDSLRAYGILPIEHAFPDHHAFIPADFHFGDDLPVLMTDKDAIKCRRFAQPGWWRVPVHAELPREFFEALAGRIKTSHTAAS
ncbi:tetraacyldisaccharide 4'-kinase [Frateuria sp. STR12]|uniref:tetraacyldisaccharide 4'-kinase n=1 Tax=Frateuria hangzhouensis TaxID=2995589 RepID=UPI002260B8CF|nr:tetraacyldisaccharide 4'-kinase [Frateuria sp. STR12]MCX7512383.1 tetraacyldisaccharide 4'-kinase [Frateuria sp. STR12]